MNRLDEAVREVLVSAPPPPDLRVLRRRIRRRRISHAVAIAAAVVTLTAGSWGLAALVGDHPSRPVHVEVVTPTTPTTSYRGPWLVPPQDVPPATEPPSPAPAAGPTVLPLSDATRATAQKALALLPAGFKITDMRDVVFPDGTRNGSVNFTVPQRAGRVYVYWVQLTRPLPMEPLLLGPGPATYHRTRAGELATVDSGTQHRSAVFITPTGLEYIAQYLNLTVFDHNGKPVAQAETSPALTVTELARFVTALATSR